MLELTIPQLEALLNEQKRVISEQITRNLSVYSFFADLSGNSEEVRNELRQECLKSDYPNDFNVLKKYLKQ